MNILRHKSLITFWLFFRSYLEVTLLWQMINIFKKTLMVKLFPVMLHRFIVLTAMGSCGSTAKQVTVLNVFQINRRKCYFIILVDISLINDTIDQFLGLLAIWISSMNCLFIFFHHFPVWILVSFYWLDVIKALILCQIYCEYFLLFFHLSFNVYYRGIKT